MKRTYLTPEIKAFQVETETSVLTESTLLTSDPLFNGLGEDYIDFE